MTKKFPCLCVFLLFISLLILSFPLIAAEPNHNPQIAIGQEVPDFNLKVSETSNSYSKSNLMGRVYLLDFWKTTCKNCVSEMPTLQKIYEIYNKKGLIIISLSFDKSFDEVNVFRKGQWKVPWFHSFVEGAFDSKTAETFGVEHLPTMILVGRYGKILWINENSSDEDLKRILSEVLH